MPLPPAWLRSIQRRPLTAVLLALLSAAAVLTAALAPVLVRAVQQSTLAAALSAADTATITVTGLADVGQPYDVARAPVQNAIDAGRQGSDAQLWDEPTTVLNSRNIVAWSLGDVAEPFNALVNPVEDCSRLTLTTGTCPRADGEILMSTDDAAAHKLAVGQQIVLAMAQAPRTEVKIVGLYDAAASPEAGLARPGTTAGALAGVASDPIVMSTVAAAKLPMAMLVHTTLQLAATLGVDDLPAARAAQEKIVMEVSAQDRLLVLETRIPDLLDRIEGQLAAAQVMIVATAAQALLLVVFVLVIVLQRLGHARAAEWSVGRLRGAPRLRWLGSIYVEPLLALIVGWPLGLAAADLTARLIADATLRPGTPVDVWRSPVLLAAGAAAAISVLALIAVSIGNVRRPLAELVQQETENRTLGVAGAVVHAVIFLLAGVTLYQLVAGGRLSATGPQLGLVAPGLLALAAALAAIRVVVALSGRFTRRSPRGLTGLVVGRHVARVPSSLNPSVTIAVAMALAVFATQVSTLSIRNQNLRAGVETGAAQVLTVAVPDGVDFVSAVRAADPSGSQAMAVLEIGASGSARARVLAVDAERLAAVASWDPAWSGVSDVADQLVGGRSAPMTLTGSTVALDLADLKWAPLPLPDPNAPGAVDPAPPPMVVLTVEVDGRWQQVPLGRLDTASTTQQLTADLPCPDGCRVVGIGLSAATNAPYKVELTVAGLETDEQPASETQAWLASTGQWRVSSALETVGDAAPVSAKVEPGASGLRLVVTDTQGGAVTSALSGDSIDPLPALLAPATTLDPVPGQVGSVEGLGLDGQQQKLAVVGQAAILPRAQDVGVMVDLVNAGRLVDPASVNGVAEVWLAPGADDSIEQALTGQGFRVLSRELVGDAETTFQQQAMTRAAAVSVDLALVALGLALIALIAARWADASRRGADWSALREGGLGRSRLRSLIRAEVALPAVLAVVLGVASGLVAVRAAAPRLPLVDPATPGPPLDLGVSWAPVGLLAAGAIVVLLVVAQVAAVVEARAGEPR